MSSLSINFLGDFFIPDIRDLNIGTSLKHLLDQGDANVVNIEGPIRTPNAIPITKSGPNLMQDEHVPQFLERNGFNVVSIANNHIMDYGPSAMAHTMSAFSENTILCGGGKYKQAYEIRVRNIGDKKIGFLALTQYEFGIVEERNGYGAAWILHPRVDEVIASAKERCDYLIILPHAGLEFFQFPLPELRTLYRHYIDMGADAVVASHPHVPQPWEMYHGLPIVYSLGNFVFDTDSSDRWWYYGLIVQCEFTETSVSLETHLLHYDRNKREVELSNNPAILSRMAALNDTFGNEADYLSAVNAKCLSLATYYDMIFEQGGYCRIDLKKSLGYIKRHLLACIGLKKQQKANRAHMINNLRCETHRWVISRIYELIKQANEEILT